MRPLMLVSLLTFSLAWGGAWIAGRQAAPAPTVPAPDREPARAPRDPAAERDARHHPRLGFTLNLHHTDRLDLYLQSIDELVALGCNSLMVATPLFQRDGAAQHVEFVPGPGRGPTREQLVQVLQYAREQGLLTALMPTVLFTEPRGNEWRGRIQPEHWSPWWDSYRSAIDIMIDISLQADVSLLVVGSELLSTEHQVAPWEALIQHCRSRFDGLLTYSTNWDHLDVPVFWSRLDMIGINGYFDLTTGSEGPLSDEALAAQWRDIQARLFTFARHIGLPLLLTEVGYPSLPTALREPWNYTAPAAGQADHAAQARGYRAFLEAWSEPLGRLAPSALPAPAGDTAATTPPNPSPLAAGVFFYAWDPYHQGGPSDTGYGVRGKPAGRLLARWLKPDHAAPPATPPSGRH